MHGLGERAQVETDDRSFEPGSRRGDDLIYVDWGRRFLQCFFSYETVQRIDCGGPVKLQFRAA